MTLTDEILFGTKAGMERLLNQGADIDQFDVYGYTPLIETAIANKTDHAEILIDRGANVNLADITGRTALHWAVDNYNMPLCELLLKHKADANAYTAASQTALVYPLLRNQHDLKKLLYRHSADLNFAQDFITAKLVGHRFQLAGQVDIVNKKGGFVELDYEGFFLEFTLGIVQQSLERYRNNYAARKLRIYFNYINEIIEQYANASQLLKYQSYTIEINNHARIINALLDHDFLLIPVAYQGHAITFVKSGNLLVRCDRGENSQYEGTVVVYDVNRRHALSTDFLKNFIYKPQSAEFVTQGIKSYLGLQPILNLPLSAQITGNCSWANVEGALPTMLFLLMLRGKKRLAESDIKKYQREALGFYHQWQEWDKDRAIEECMNGFEAASPARKATKATILGAILFQQCNYLIPKAIERAEKMLPILTIPEYQYILKTYLEIYWKQRKTRAGHNLVQLLDFCGVKL